MTHTKQLTGRRSMYVPQFTMMMLAAFVLVFVLSSPARAQWSTGTNINNTNSGTVSVGTTSPGGDKLITSGNILAGDITSHTQLYSGYDSQANVIMELGYGTATANITPLASLVLSKNLTSTNNPVGVISFANSSIANGNDKRLSLIGSWTDGATNSGTLQFFSSSAGVLNERMRITSGGNVGIGTSNPLLQSGSTNRMVEIQGSLNPGLALTATSVGGRQYYLYSAQSNPGYFSIFDATAGADRLTVNSSGNVGLGTASPATKLELAPNTAIKLGNAYFSSGGDYLHLANNEWFNGSSWVTTAAGGLIQISGQDVSFYRHDASGGHTQSMIINSSGSVGIGTATPNTSYKLDVNGNTNVTGNLNASGTITGGNIVAKYQDVAEWVQSSQELSAGTVVVLDQTKSNQVIASSVSYDTRVAGVISLQPGIALGENGAGKVLVATTGRVRIKVDASRGSIQVGDLLVTSDVPGVAMKSQPIDVGGVQIHRPGTLIGKALEPLAKGTGEILVLLSLQ